MRGHLIIDKKIFKKFIHFLFFLFMCGVMAHKRGTGFDAIYSRLSFMVLMTFFFLYSIKYNILKTKKNSYFIKMTLFILLYTFSYIWAKDKAVCFDIGIFNCFIQILGMDLVIEISAENISDCKSILKKYLFSIIYMLIWLVFLTPLSSWGSERVGEEMALNPNTIGIRCAVGFLIALYFASEKDKYYALYYVLAILQCVVGLYSGSRKSFLILTVGFAIYYIAKKRGAKVLLRALVVITAIFVLIYIVLNNDVLYQVLGKRLERAFSYWFLGGSGTTDRSSVERKFFMSYALKMFLNRPFLGYGGNGFVAEMSNIGYRHVTYSHCNYLEILSTLGIVGFVIYYAIQIPMLCATAHLYKNRIGKTNNIVCLILALLITNLIIEIFIVSYYSVSMQTLLIILFVSVQCLIKYQGD